MRYKSGADFRRALEDQLRYQHSQSGAPLVRLRKFVAFDRFLARLVMDQPGKWILKGGLALQLRIGDRARTTKDIDLLSLADAENLGALLISAGRIDLGDWFTFEVQNVPSTLPDEAQGARYPVRSLLDGRNFESFHVDIGLGDPIVSPVNTLTMPPLLKFAEIQPVSLPCYPLTQHLAEKLHAYTRIYVSGESSRVKDLIDILLIIQENPINGEALLHSIRETFSYRKTHLVPKDLPEPPSSWILPFAKLATEVGLDASTLSMGLAQAQSFFIPVLAGQDCGDWDPNQQTWISS
jgi:hypothetical protein